MEQLSLFDDVLPIAPPKIKVEYVKTVKALEREFLSYEHLLKFGGQDPFWCDGHNLNLVRNHIIYYKDKLVEFYTEYGCELPEVYFRPTPDPVENEYLAPNSKSGRFYTFSRAI